MGARVSGRPRGSPGRAVNAGGRAPVPTPPPPPRRSRVRGQRGRAGGRLGRSGGAGAGGGQAPEGRRRGAGWDDASGGTGRTQRWGCGTVPEEEAELEEVEAGEQPPGHVGAQGGRVGAEPEPAAGLGGDRGDGQQRQRQRGPSGPPAPRVLRRHPPVGAHVQRRRRRPRRRQQQLPRAEPRRGGLRRHRRDRRGPAPRRPRPLPEPPPPPPPRWEDALSPPPGKRRPLPAPRPQPRGAPRARRLCHPPPPDRSRPRTAYRRSPALLSPRPFRSFTAANPPPPPREGLQPSTGASTRAPPQEAASKETRGPTPPQEAGLGSLRLVVPLQAGGFQDRAEASATERLPRFPFRAALTPGSSGAAELGGPGPSRGQPAPRRWQRGPLPVSHSHTEPAALGPARSTPARPATPLQQTL